MNEKNYVCYDPEEINQHINYLIEKKKTRGKCLEFLYYLVTKALSYLNVVFFLGEMKTKNDRFDENINSVINNILR